MKLILIPIKANLITKKESCRQDTVGASGTGNIEMIFAVLGVFLLTYEFGRTGLSLEEKIYIKYCHYLKIFFGVLGKSYDGD